MTLEQEMFNEQARREAMYEMTGLDKEQARLQTQRDMSLLYASGGLAQTRGAVMPPNPYAGIEGSYVSQAAAAKMGQPEYTYDVSQYPTPQQIATNIEIPLEEVQGYITEFKDFTNEQLRDALATANSAPEPSGAQKFIQSLAPWIETGLGFLEIFDL